MIKTTSEPSLKWAISNAFIYAVLFDLGVFEIWVWWLWKRCNWSCIYEYVFSVKLIGRNKRDLEEWDRTFQWLKTCLKNTDICWWRVEVKEIKGKVNKAWYVLIFSKTCNHMWNVVLFLFFYFLHKICKSSSSSSMQDHGTGVLLSYKNLTPK